MKQKKTTGAIALFETRIWKFDFSAALTKALGAKTPAEKRKKMQGILRECLALRDTDQAGQDWSRMRYPGGYTSYSSVDRLDLWSTTFQHLAKILTKEAHAYAANLGLDLGDRPLYLQTLWLNIMDTDGHHSWHKHPGSVISGTVYLALPPSTDSIRFEDPRFSLFMNRPPLKTPSRKADPSSSQTHYSHRPKVGEGVLFESWLTHEVPRIVKKITTPRISVSFNFGWNHSK